MSNISVIAGKDGPIVDEREVDRFLGERGLSQAALATTISSIAPPRFGSRPFHAAWRVAGETAEDLPIMPAPPTVTTGTANLDASLTQEFRYWTTPDVYRVGGGTPAVYATTYLRAPVVTLPTGTGNASATQNAQTWWWEFETTSQKVMIHMNGSSLSGLKIEVDGQKITTGPVAYAATSGNAFYLITNTTAAPRHYRIYVELNAAFRSVFIAPGTTINRPRKVPVKFAALGDSIHASAGSTARPDGNFVTLLGKRLGWDDARQIALGGSGFIALGPNNSTFGDATRLSDIATAAPDVILVSATPNDSTNTAPAITNAALTALQGFRATAPEALIIVAGLIPPAAGVNAATLANENAVKNAYDQWNDVNSIWIPVSTDPNGPWALTYSDSVHPNSTGHETMAKKFTTAIRAKLT